MGSLIKNAAFFLVEDEALLRSPALRKPFLIESLAEMIEKALIDRMAVT